MAAAPLFGGLDEVDLRRLRRIALDKFFAKGRTIFLEGDEGAGFYLVADGRVKVYKLSPEGKEHILHIYGPGNPIGEVPVFSGRHLPANAQALVKSHLLFFPRDAFVGLITETPSLAMNMLAVMSRRLREFTVQIENLSLKEVPGRLASYLLVLMEEQAAGEAVRLPVSKGQLASLLGTIPETLSRIFARMSGEGLIAVSGPHIRIHDPEGLALLAREGRL
jgi:CRP/FNR family transcriptional regulator